MSQQTTLAVVVPRFETFVKTLPSLQDLATCPETTLRSLWAGLGYYARARNLQRGAKYISEQWGGQFPTTYSQWLQVPGCGPYTAAMVASLGFQEPVPALDGNGIRVITRWVGFYHDIWSPSGQQVLRQFLKTVIDDLTPRFNPGEVNEALIELGATVCRKHNPVCDQCPLSKGCYGFTKGLIDQLPAPKPRTQKISVSLASVVFYDSATQQVALFKRDQGFLSQTDGFPLLSAGSDGRCLAEMPLSLKGILSKHKLLHNRLFGEGFIKHTITHHAIQCFPKLFMCNADKGGFRDQNLKDWVGCQQLQWVPSHQAYEHLSASLDQKVWKHVCKSLDPSVNLSVN